MYDMQLVIQSEATIAELDAAADAASHVYCVMTVNSLFVLKY